MIKYHMKHKVNFFLAYFMFLNLLCEKCVQFLSTGSSFVHIMITRYVDFCKNELRFLPLTIFQLNSILLLMMKITRKQFFKFICEKLEQNIIVPLLYTFIFNIFLLLSCPPDETLMVPTLKKKNPSGTQVLEERIDPPPPLN